MLPEGRSYELSAELLKGAVDLHLHAGPHLKTSPRSVDPFQAAIQARDAGMAAIVYMDVFEMSNGTSWIVNRVVDGIKTFGGINLNTVYDGVNPRAVKTALYYGDGAKYVAFGTHSTHWMTSREGQYVNGEWVPSHVRFPKFRDEELARSIKIPEGKPTPEIDEVLQLIADHPDVYLITGHVSAAEAVRLCELGHDYGIHKVVVSSTIPKLSTAEQLKKMVDTGAYLEYTLAGYTHSTGTRKTDYYVELDYASDPIPGNYPKFTIKNVADHIREYGADHCIVASDLGVYTLPPPVEGMREFVACLLDLGVSTEAITSVVKTNPRRLLDL
ncbi:TPA: hypothetical protein HA344_03495 [Candidatus Bathyarchaeota archaeon]|nr:hypothetical protein [Candidatus Bathyarchaeota archaeon]